VYQFRSIDSLQLELPPMDIDMVSTIEFATAVEIVIVELVAVGDIAVAIVNVVETIISCYAYNPSGSSEVDGESMICSCLAGLSPFRAVNSMIMNAQTRASWVSMCIIAMEPWCYI